MRDGLFDESDLYDGDPVHPDLDTPTPAVIVATLTKPQREERVTRLVEQAHQIVDEAIETHGRNRIVVAQCVLFSGGNDSTILVHMMSDRASHAIHANTTIGIEATRQFVRETCHAMNLPLIEKIAPESYRDLVIDQGFPGPPMHGKMYQRLKERCLEAARRELISDGRKQRLVFIAGRRRQESSRRKAIPLHERKDSMIWASPLAMWTKPDMNTYRLMHRETATPVPVNEVSDLIHMSGECLCGAFAKPGELEEIRLWYPDVAAEIDQLQRDVRAAGHVAPFDRWGHGEGKPSESGPMCSSCEGQTELFSLSKDGK